MNRPIYSDHDLHRYADPAVLAYLFPEAPPTRWGQFRLRMSLYADRIRDAWAALKGDME